MNFRVAIGLWLAPGVALAHGGFGQGTPFFSGVMHVLMSVSVLLPLIAVGLLASQQGRIVLPRAQVLLPGSMALGAGLALSGVDSSVLIVVGQLAVIVVGVLVAVAASLHVRLVMALIALVGALCGYALMRADAPDSAVVWFVAGTMLGKQALGAALDELVAANFLDEDEAYEAAGWILAGTARRLYKMDA